MTVGKQLGCLPQWQTIEVGVRPWWWGVGSDNDVEKLGPTMVLRNRDWTTRCAECWSVVSIVRLRKTFRNCLSPRVEEPRSEVKKCVRTCTTESSPVFDYVFVLCGLHMYTLSIHVHKLNKRKYLKVIVPYKKIRFNVNIQLRIIKLYMYLSLLKMCIVLFGFPNMQC